MSSQIVFRNDNTVAPRWQYYGVDVNVVGGNESLSAARCDAREAVDFLTGSNSSVIQEHIEWRATADTEDSLGVFVRARRDLDSERWVRRSELANAIVQLLQQQPELAETFASELLTDMGSSVAIVALPDDTVAEAVESIGRFDTAYIGMPANDRINWLAVSGSQVEVREGSARLSDECPSIHTTVVELMTKVGVIDPSMVKELTAV